MSLTRVRAILLQELFITRRSFEVVMDLPFFSVVTILVFGYITLYLTSAAPPAVAYYLLLGMLLWEIVRITQYSMSVGALWNVWSRNLSNMFVSPLSVPEYLAGHMITSVVKAALIFLLVSTMAAVLFQFNIFALGPVNLILYFVELTLFSWSLGIFILGLVFRFGTRIAALSWGLVFLFQPLCAAFFPLTTLPAPLQAVAVLLPPTHVFEAARAALVEPAVDWRALGIAFAENLLYFVLALAAFQAMFTKSRETGQFARNEG